MRDMIMQNENVAAFLHQMTKVNLTLRAFMRQKFKQHGVDITFEMLQVLRFLWEKDGVNQQEIADAIIKDKASLTYLIDNLVHRKLVQRAPDNQDRRNKIITLTEEGHQLATLIKPWLKEMYQIAARGVEPELLVNGITLFEKFQKNFENNRGESK